jgi:hypothetical protein
MRTSGADQCICRRRSCWPSRYQAIPHQNLNIPQLCAHYLVFQGAKYGGNVYIQIRVCGYVHLRGDDRSIKIQVKRLVAYVSLTHE